MKSSEMFFQSLTAPFQQSGLGATLTVSGWSIDFPFGHKHPLSHPPHHPPTHTHSPNLLLTALSTETEGGQENESAQCIIIINERR